MAATASSPTAEVYEYSSSSRVQLGSDINAQHTNSHGTFRVAISGEWHSASSALEVKARSRARFVSLGGGSSLRVASGNSLARHCTGPSHMISLEWTSRSTRTGHIAIGAKSNDDSANNAGQAQVFALSDSATIASLSRPAQPTAAPPQQRRWTRVGAKINGLGGGDNFGEAALSSDGTKLAVGAIGKTSRALGTMLGGSRCTNTRAAHGVWPGASGRCSGDRAGGQPPCLPMAVMSQSARPSTTAQATMREQCG